MSYRNILYALGPKQELTPGASITWPFDGRPAFVAISINGTLTVTGPLADFPMVGLLKVTHTAAGTTLTLTGDTSNVVWSTGAGQHTVLEFTWDGSEYVWTSRTKSATAALTQLDTPADFTATPNGSTEIILAYGDVTGETNFEIQVAALADKSDAATLTSPAANVLSYTHTGLAAETTRYYRIRAIGDGATYANSAWSAWVQATTGAAAVYLPHQSTFTATDGTLLTAYTPEQGNAWTNDQGTWEIQGGRLKPLTHSGNAAIAGVETGTTNVTATMVAKALNAGDLIQMKLRMTDASNNNTLNITNAYVQLRNMSGSDDLLIAEAEVARDTADHSYEVTINGSTCVVKRDGVQVLSTTLTTLHAGTKVGVVAYSPSDPLNAVTFDSLNIVAP